MKQKKRFLAFFFLGFMGISTLYAQYDFMHGATFSTFDRGYVFMAPNIVEQLGFGAHQWDVIVVNSGTYSIEHDHGIPFINFYWNDGTQERYLMLINDCFMVLYSDNTMPAFLGLRGHHMISNGGSPGWISRIYTVRASSTLREGNLVYAATPERLFLHINRVWAVEGGVGERLYINIFSREWGVGCVHLWISIGYVHFSRPYLFQHNSRPKRIRLSGTNWWDGEIYSEQELRDTPNFQRICLPRYLASGSLQIEILEIFPGIRYNHMCINSIVTHCSP